MSEGHVALLGVQMRMDSEIVDTVIDVYEGRMLTPPEVDDIDTDGSPAANDTKTSDCLNYVSHLLVIVSYISCN